MKVLILGATGLLGNTLYRYLSLKKSINVFGTYRDEFKIKILKKKVYIKNFIYLNDVNNKNNICKIIKNIKPVYVINCIGIVKKRKNSKQLFLKINTELPKFLGNLTKSLHFNLIHLSTDCVFSGKKGNYSEKDNPDPIDFYGKSKLLGEVVSNKSLTIRTSIIGHEIQSSLGLLGWFLKKKNIHGFTRCFFSGFPTIIISEIIYKYFLQKNKLPIEGLVHIASQKISKFDLLSKIKKIYKLNITIKKKSDFFIDRSLNSNMFNKKFKFKAKPWNYMIKRMYEFY